MTKKRIKEFLREEIMEKNILNVLVTRPDQELIIMRGIPGSGKSTKSKKLVGEGIIHSTDDLIEATGDYNGYFKKMIESGDWSPHAKMHNKNFLNAKKSMLEGITPVVIDNTNLRPRESKKYVEAALKMGLHEKNIKIVDVGLGGQTPEVLANRNSHNVSLPIINKMVETYRSVGTLTVEKIINHNGKTNVIIESEYNEKILYSAVVLTPDSKEDLLYFLGNQIPSDWKVFAHHMTIVFGKGLDNKNDLGKEVTLYATEIGMSDMAMAVKVEGYPSTNKIPHITLAINVNDGGKPVNSNQIANWKALPKSIKLSGIVREIKAK